MRLVERFASIIPATRTIIPSKRTRFAAGLALAAASFFYLAAMANTQRGQVDQDIVTNTQGDQDIVGSITSILDDPDDTGPSWRCVDVPITIKCDNNARIDFKIITAPAR